MTYLVHINPRPGEDNRIVEVEATGFNVHEGSLRFWKSNELMVAAFASGIWNYVEPKK